MVYVFVHNKSTFCLKALGLTPLCFKLTEFSYEPGCRVSKGDVSGFEWSKGI